MMNKIKIAATCLLLLFAACILPVMFASDTNRTEEAEPSQFSKVYEMYFEGVPLQVQLPARISLPKPRREIVLTATPTLFMSSGGQLFFKTSGLGVLIECYGNTIYTYEYYPENPTQEYGAKWHCVPLSNEYFGKQIRIHFLASKDCTTFKMDDIYYCSERAAIQSTTISSILPLILAIFTLAVGITITFMGIIVLKKLSYLESYLWYILFCIAAAVWILTGTPIVQMLLDFPHFLFHLRMTSYSCMTLFIGMHLTKRYRGGKNFRFAMGAVNAFYLIALLFLTAIGVLNPLFSYGLSHLAAIEIIAIILYAEIRRARREKGHALAIILTCATGVLLLLEMLLKLLTLYSGDFTMQLLLLFSLAPLSVSFKRFVARAQEAVLSQRVLHAIAYTDSQTGLFNRTMFNRDIEKHGKNPMNTYIAVFDLNDLKHTNDTLGHTVGDDLIRAAANIIGKTFKGVGKTYRIGGDEFSVICVSPSAREINDAVKNLADNISSYNKTESRFDVSIAYAIKKFDPETDTTLADLFKRVDKFMYVHKQRMKKGRVR